MKRSKEDILGNLLLMKFLMEYWNAIDDKIFDMASSKKDPDMLPPDLARVLEVMDGFQKDIESIARDQTAGRDTKAKEEDLLRRFIVELSDKAKFAISKSSPQEIAAIIPRAFLFNGVERLLKKHGGDKIAMLIQLNERQRNFDDSLDKKPDVKKPKPPKPS